MEKNENSKYQEKNLYSINIIQSKQYITFSINSGEYNATFYENCNYDKESLKKYMCRKKTTIISGIIFLILCCLFFLPLLNLIDDKTTDEEVKIVYFIIVGILGLIDLFIWCIALNCLNGLKFDYILYDLQRNGARITWENKNTGTISYIKNGRKTQLSVYRGYNSHTNSRYWII